MTFKEYISRSPLLFLLIGINAAVTAAVGIFFLSGISIAPWLAVPSDWATLATRPWTVVTYMFTQVSFLHLLFNMLWLLWFGRIFLYVASTRTFLYTYLCGGLTGAAFFIAACAMASPPPGNWLIGSSAALLAVMTATTVMAPNLELRLFLVTGVRLKYVALLCILLTFLGIGGGNAGGFSAHFGGVVFGLLAPRLFKGERAVSSSGLMEKLRKAKSRMKRRRVPEALAGPSSLRPAARGKESAGSSLSDEQRLDELLDKVRASGYASLSESEKRELNTISSRL